MSEDIKNFVFRVKPELHRKVKAHLLLQGLSFQEFGEVVAEAIAEDSTATAQKAVRALITAAKAKKARFIRAGLEEPVE